MPSRIARSTSPLVTSAQAASGFAAAIANTRANDHRAIRPISVLPPSSRAKHDAHLVFDILADQSHDGPGRVLAGGDFGLRMHVVLIDQDVFAGLLLDDELRRDVAAVDAQPRELGQSAVWASPGSCFRRRSARGA